jgi:cysteine desulfurase
MVPFVLGAGHEHGLRPGTENVAAIVGLGVACEIAGRDLEIVAARVARLRDELWERLAWAVPGIQLNGHGVLRLPNTLNVRFPGTSGTAILDGAPEIAASTGSACHAGGESASAVILAMDVAADEAIGSVRLSIGRGTTPADIAAAADALVRSWRCALRPAP